MGSASPISRWLARNPLIVVGPGWCQHHYVQLTMPNRLYYGIQRFGRSKVAPGDPFWSSAKCTCYRTYVVDFMRPDLGSSLFFTRVLLRQTPLGKFFLR